MKIRGIEELPEAAKALIADLGDRRVVAFDAPMGAGKTTFISALCRMLGVEEDDINSPTFSIVNEYHGQGIGKKIFHFDCYRLESPEEVLDMGAQDYLDSGALCLIEWPEIIEGLLPDDAVRVSIRENEDGSREINWQ